MASVKEPRPRSKGLHSHVCSKCWHIWSHDGSTVTKETVEAEHQCPACGEPWADSLARTEGQCRKAAETKDHGSGDPFYDLLRAFLT